MSVVVQVRALALNTASASANEDRRADSVRPIPKWIPSGQCRETEFKQLASRGVLKLSVDL